MSQTDSPSDWSPTTRPAHPICWRTGLPILLWLLMSSAHAAENQTLAAGLRIKTQIADDVLEVPARSVVQLRPSIAAPSGRTVRRVETLLIRAGGIQEYLRHVDPAVGASYLFKDSGVALVAVTMTDEDSAVTSAPTTTVCSKLILRVAGESQNRAEPRAAAISSKVAQRFEIVPFTNPAAVTLGSDLPVRAYVNFDKASGLEITAYRADGSTQRRTTGDSGMAVFRVDRAGRWLIRFQSATNGAVGIAELIFEIPAPAEQGDRAP